jgi:hypothetical protein
MNTRLSGIFSARAARFSAITTRGRAIAVEKPWNTRNSSAAGTPHAIASR